MDQQNIQKSSLHKVLGIATFLLGLSALIFSFVFAAGIYIIAIAIVGIISGVIAFVMAGKIHAPKGIITGGLILSLVGIVLTAYQFESPVKAEIIPEKAATVKDEKFIESIDSSLNDIESSLRSLEKDSTK